MNRHVVVVPVDATKSERAYLEALQRVVDREPISEVCKDLLAKGELKICQWHVVWEAGRKSRTPIAGTNRVQAAILLAKRARSTPALAGPEAAVLEIAQELREERAKTQSLLALIRAERREKEAAYTKQGALILLVEELGATRALRERTPEERASARRSAEEMIPRR